MAFVGDASDSARGGQHRVRRTRSRSAGRLPLLLIVQPSARIRLPCPTAGAHNLGDTRRSVRANVDRQDWGMCSSLVGVGSRS